MLTLPATLFVVDFHACQKTVLSLAMSNAKRFLRFFILNSNCQKGEQRSHLKNFAFGDRRFQPVPGRRIGFSLGLAGAIALGYASTASAQTAITNLNATYQLGTSSSYSTTTANPCGTYSLCDSGITLNFGVGTTNDLKVTGFRVNTANYSLIRLADNIQFQRINNVGVTGRRNVLFFEQDFPNPNTQLRSTYVNSVEAGILGDISNRGIDNAFSNVNGNVSSNNVERIDYIVSNGLTESAAVQNDIGFLVLERGGNDPFKVAAITSIDANGKPASYAPLKSIASNAWGPSGFSLTSAVMRREESEPAFRPSHIVTSQTINGIFLSLANLGALPNQTIYGYSLFANDTPGGSSSSDLVNLTNFPTNTPEASGGLDLVAGGGIYLRDSVQSVSGTLYTDVNADNSFNTGEPTLPNSIEVILYKDNNSNGRYDVGEQVQTTNTAGNKGQYTFAGVANGTYGVFVNTSDPDIPRNLSLSTLNNLKVVVSNSSSTGINFGFKPANDYGDAPSSYGDASHIIAVASTLYLGSVKPDSEAGTQLGSDLGAAAAGDDISGTDDEDAFATLPNVPATGTYSLTVPLTNTSGGSATLHAWIDFNRNNKFEVGEYQTANINSNATTANISWNIPSGAVSGKSYARFRLTASNLTDDASTSGIDERSVGNAANGEVEDYSVTISAIANNPNILLVKRITAINSQTINPNDSTPLNRFINDGIDNSADDNSNWPSNYLIGALTGGLVRPVSNTPADTVEYSIYFLSAGNAEAKNVLLCDRIPQYTTFLPNVYSSAPPASPLSTRPNLLGMALAINGSEFSLTGADDGDAGYYFPAGINPSTRFANVSCGGPNNNGAVVINLGNLPPATAPGQPTGAFGRLRFQVGIH